MTGAADQSHAQRLARFCRLAEEYDAWAASFPTSVARFDLASDRPLSPHDRSYLGARALILRRFLVVESEVTHATGVLEALDDSLRAGHAPIDSLRASFERIARAAEVMAEPAPPPRHGPVLRDLLRGIRPHRGRTAHATSVPRPSLTHDLALWTFVTEGESFLRRLRRAIRAAAEAGHLTPDARKEVVAAA